ncbi:MAG: 2-isopropylmalate synthase [Armatimonadota bacterium]|nr:MAG: 2-isopropylmalate synthase [Armatimonadota bacterium]
MTERREVQEVGQPNLLEDVFPYDRVPLITFDGRIREEINGRVVEFDPREAVRRDLFITDTTFRDGQQARPPYSLEQIRDIYSLLVRLSGPNGVIRLSEFFLYTPKDRQAVDLCRELGHEYPRITGWIRADEGDFRLVKDMGLDETGMLTSASDYHIFHKQKMTRREAFDQYIRVVEGALATGVRPRCHLEDVTRADIEGFVLPFVQKLAELGEQAPDHLKPKVRLCDTLGYGVTFPGAALPRSIPKLVHTIVNEGGIPSDRLEWHGHNDFHKAHINGVTCWLYGCDAVNTTLLGFGERTGNPPLEGALVEYAGLKGTLNGADLSVLTEIARYFDEHVGAQIPAGQPFVGSNFNRTMAGIHAEGLRRDERIYNIFDTRVLLGQPPRVAITDKSGVDGITHWVNDFLGLEGDGQVRKRDVLKIARWVMDQYTVHGRLTGISDDELKEQVRLHLPELYEQRIRQGGAAGASPQD